MGLFSFFYTKDTVKEPNILITKTRQQPFNKITKTVKILGFEISKKVLFSPPWCAPKLQHNLIEDNK